MEDNRIIAEFMNYPTSSEYWKGTSDWDHEDYKDYYYIDGKYNHMDGSNFHVDDMKFDLSWDWLMPVIKKCRATEVDKDRELSKQRLIDNINFRLFTLDLLGTHSNIIDFIKWYERKPIVTTF